MQRYGQSISLPRCVSHLSLTCACCQCQTSAGVTGAVCNASATRWRRWENSMSCLHGCGITKALVRLHSHSPANASTALVCTKPEVPDSIALHPIGSSHLQIHKHREKGRTL